MAFNEMVSTPLCEIMGRYGSDKGSVNILSSWHNYTTYYYSIFKDLKDKSLRIFELGLGTNNIALPSNMGKDGQPGASLRGWAEFFPTSKIYGADIDKDILFNTDKIQTYYCDQTDPETIKEMWSHSDLELPFDIIIEDGLHTFSANVCFFENSIHKLVPGGYYIIEDISIHDAPLFLSKINEWKITFPKLTFTYLQIPNRRNTHDNNLLVIKA